MRDFRRVLKRVSSVQQDGKGVNVGNVSPKTSPAVRNKTFGANKLKRRIGSGGSSEVYLAETPTGQRVAVKVLRANPKEPGQAGEQLKREFEVLSQIRTSGVAHLVAEGLGDAEPWVAFEYVEGLSLQEYVEKHGAIPEGVLRALLFRLAGILAELHEQGVAHRDLSPNNIILSQQGPVLVDFGTARIDTEHAVTGSRLLIGTPGFAAPEVVAGQLAGTPADIYALAKVADFACGDTTLGWSAGEEEILQSAVAIEPRDRPSVTQLVEIFRADTSALEDLEFESRELAPLPRKIPIGVLVTAALAPVAIAVAFFAIFWPDNTPAMLETTQEAAPAPEQAPQVETQAEPRVATGTSEARPIEPGQGPVLSRDLAYLTDKAKAWAMEEEEPAGGLVKAMFRPHGWTYQQTPVESAYVYVGSSLSPERVVEDHHFFEPSDPFGGVMSVVLSVQPETYSEPTDPYRIEADDPFHRHFLLAAEAMESGVPDAAGCSMTRPERLWISGDWRIAVTTNAGEECSDRSPYLLYISAFIAGSPFQIDFLARSLRPISAVQIIDHMISNEIVANVKPIPNDGLPFWELAGWESSSSAEQHISSRDGAFFSAPVLLPPGAAVALDSGDKDATVYEVRLVIPTDVTLSLGQWIPYNALKEPNLFDKWPSRDFAIFTNTTEKTGVLIITAEPTTTWSPLKEANHKRDAFEDRDPLRTGVYNPPLARIYYSETSLEELADIPVFWTIDSMTGASEWEDLPAFVDGLLILETGPRQLEPMGIGLSGFPVVQELPVPDDDGTLNSLFIGPDDLRIDVGRFPVYRHGKIGEDDYFEGSKQWISRAERPPGLASHLRLYFGDSGPKLLGREWPLSDSGQTRCMDHGGWIVTNRSETMRLVIEMKAECRVNHEGHEAVTRSPLFKFSLERIGPIGDDFGPVLWGDYIPSDLLDVVFIQNLITQLFDSMANREPIDAAAILVKEACSNWVDAMLLLLNNEYVFDEDSLDLFDEAIEQAAEAAETDERWTDFSQNLYAQDLALLIGDLEIGLYFEIENFEVCSELINQGD